MAIYLETKNKSLLDLIAMIPEVSSEEADLLYKINAIFSSDKRQRYNKLYAKFKNDNLKKKEYEELLELSNEFEILNAERLKYIGELAKLRGHSFKQTMISSEIMNLNNK